MLYDPKWEQKQTSLAEWRQVLLDGAENIERYGHVKKSLGSKSMGFCLMGAMIETHNPAWCEAITKIDRFMGTNPVDWNNAPERTAAEVITAMRKCAAEYY